VTASIPILRVDYLVGEIDLSMNRRTVYSAVGDIVLYASLCLLFVLSCVIFYRRITAGRTR
jgi:apolipoprotein N-acyltransferase